MTNERVLARVDDDLAQGHTYVAIQRLTTYVHNDPSDVVARARLASIHRGIGNLVEAGRWGFVTEDTTDEATAAFEKAHPDPRTRREVVRWNGSRLRLGPQARRRLAELDAVIAASPPDERDATTFRTAEGKFDPAGAGCALLAFVTLGAVVIALVVGTVTIAEALF